MSDTNNLVIKVENGQSINHPVTYSNFLLLFPDCLVQDTPTNEVISIYGYEVFSPTPYPQFESGSYIKQNDGRWTNTWVAKN
jgi:hypothetical protein